MADLLKNVFGGSQDGQAAAKPDSGKSSQPRRAKQKEPFRECYVLS